MHPTTFTFTVLVLGLALTCVGCDNREEPPQAPAPLPERVESWPATRSTDRANYRVTLRPLDGPIERSRHFSLELIVQPGENIPAPTKVVVDADMPAHRHGMNTQPEIIEAEEGHPRVEGMLFHMAGEWVINVDITNADGVERAVFPVHIE